MMNVIQFISFCFTSSLLIVFGDGQVWPNMINRKYSPLNVDGNWSPWQENWSACYNNTRNVENFYPPWENFFIMNRNRTCDNPKPLAGGKDCELPSHRFRQCSCMNPLGIGNNRINSSQISSSRYLDGYSPGQVRFGDAFPGWCSKSKLSLFRKTYIQIDFDQFATVGAISIVGVAKGRITRFKLKYSLNGRVWKRIYQYNDQRNSIFKGNLLPGKIKTNKFDSHKVMKYLRLIPTETFGLPCLKMEVYGCVFTCGKLLTSSFGEIIARSSPQIDQNCLWRIEVLNTTSLTFDFNVFYILCEHGYLDFHDGNFPFNNAPLIERVCLQNEDEARPVLKLNTNKVWLNFVSNSSSNEVGFNIRYFSECSQIIHLVEGEEVTIQSPNYPDNYFDNLKCSWIIYSPATTNKIDIITNDFNVESTRNPTLCVDDVVIVETYDSGKNESVGKYCNNNKPGMKIEVNTEKLFVRFISDEYSSDKGFSFTVVSGVKIFPTTEVTRLTQRAKLVTNRGKLATNRRINKNGTVFIEGKTNSSNTLVEEIKKESDDTWTIIIICVFSAFALVLLCTIVGMNIRRFLKNRSDIEVQCAKIREDEKLKKKNKVTKINNEYENSNLIKRTVSPVQVRVDSDSGEGSALLPPAENDKNTNQTDESKLDSADIIQPHNSNEKVEQLDHTDVDGDADSNSYDSSSPQIHSPLKTGVDPVLDESCDLPLKTDVDCVLDESCV